MVVAMNASTELTNGYRVITRREKTGMKTKLLLVGIVAVVLGTMIAVPVLTEDEAITMFVSRVRLAYNGRSSSSPDRVVAMVHVRDTNKAAVAGATVSAQWTLPNGTVLKVTADTDFQGIATFQVWAGRGTYTLCVTDVAKDECEYDPDLNLETCGEIEITWPFSPPR